MIQELTMSIWNGSILFPRCRMPLKHVFCTGCVLLFFWVWHIYDSIEFLQQKSTIGRLSRTSFSSSKNSQEKRLKEIREMTKFAWENYRQHAFGADEYKPISGEPVHDLFGGMGCTLVDALDTLWIMGLKKEFKEARTWVKSHLRFDALVGTISVFETGIRILGGLLGAYELSGDVIFRDRAQQLGDELTKAYNHDEGLFRTMYNQFKNTKSFSSKYLFRPLIAEIGSIQLEMQYLSRITGEMKYAVMGDKFYDTLQNSSFDNSGLYTVHYDTHLKKYSYSDTSISFGAQADSFYEYLLKVWILNTKRNKSLKKLYLDAIDGMERYLLSYSVEQNGRRNAYLKQLIIPSTKSRSFQMLQANNNEGKFNSKNLYIPGFKIPLIDEKKMDHFACFVPGLLALGTIYLKSPTKIEKHLSISKQLMNTCYEMYSKQITFLSPQEVSFPGFKILAPDYSLRPESIESLFYLYRITKDKRYREMGWKIFKAMKRHCKCPNGYASLKDVRKPSLHIDETPSFFFAETLKYHYLLQASEDEIPLHKYVFNTEGHPFSIENN